VAGVLSDLGGMIQGLALAGRYLYVADPPNGLPTVDVADPARPRLAGFEALGATFSVAAASGYAYVARGFDGLSVVDVADPARPRTVADLSLPGYTRGVTLSGHYLYVAAGPDGLRVVDVADPRHPGHAETVDLPGSAFAVAVVKPYAYVAAGPGGLHVLDVSDPAHPVEVASLAAGYIRSLAVAGSRAYLADFSRGLVVADLSEPTRPVVVQVVRTRSFPFDVAAREDRVFVAEGGCGLRVLDASDPSVLSELWTYDGVGFATAVVAKGSYVFAGGDPTHEPSECPTEPLDLPPPTRSLDRAGPTGAPAGRAAS